MSAGLVAMFALTGGLLNAVQTTMYAVAAHVYPTDIRGTGVGTAVAVGRIGNVVASYVGAFALDSGRRAGLLRRVGAGDGHRLRVARARSASHSPAGSAQ